jgi:hypothetical protein
MNPKIACIAAALLAASSALAAPKIDKVVVKPNQAQASSAKPTEVEVSISISRTRFDTGSCDARVDFGDGEGRSLDFGVAATRTVRHAYKKGGSYNVVVRGAGGTPCEGSQQAPLTIAQAPEPKKAGPKKADAKKDQKKAAAKKAPAKKKADEKKKADGKKAPAKKDEKKKDDGK